MKIPTCLLAAVLSAFAPLSLHAEEAPPAWTKTWEIHARMDGGGNPRLAELTRRLLAPVAHAIQPGVAASFHAAGFENPKTRGGDWIAEVRGISDARGLLEDAAKYGNFRLTNDILFLTHRQQVYALWSPREGVIRAAYPAANHGIELPGGIDPAADTWLSGGIPFAGLKDELPESGILRLIERFDFAIAAKGAEISADILAESITPELTAEVSSRLRRLSAAATLISGDGLPVEALAKNLTVTRDEEKVRVRFTIPEETLERGLLEIQPLIKAALGK